MSRHTNWPWRDRFTLPLQLKTGYPLCEQRTCEEAPERWRQGSETNIAGFRAERECPHSPEMVSTVMDTTNSGSQGEAKPSKAITGLWLQGLGILMLPAIPQINVNLE